MAPRQDFDAELHAPGSKSYTLRGMMTGALATGKTVLTNAILCEDTRVMAQALRLLGIGMEYRDGAFYIDGRGGHIAHYHHPLEMGNSGAPLRFITALVSLGDGRYVITGNERMRERPVQDLLDALDQWGVQGQTQYRDGCPPLFIEAEGIKGGMAMLKGDRSSQFLSALLLVAPYAQARAEIEVLGEQVSKPYIDITVEVIRSFGVNIQQKDHRHFTISPHVRYQGREYQVEGDWSSASYFFAAAAISKGRVVVHGLNPLSRQGDRGFLKILQEMDCRVDVGDGWVEVEGGDLKGLNINMADMPDLVPSVAVIAAFAQGETAITGVPHLRIKESDRIRVLVEELHTAGIGAQELDDGLVITGGLPHGGRIRSRGDHRIAMAFGIMGLRVPGIEIEGKGCVEKSYPSFWEELKRIAP